MNLFVEPFSSTDGACGGISGANVNGDAGVVWVALVVLHVLVQQVVHCSNDAVVGNAGEEPYDVVVVDLQVMWLVVFEHAL